MVDNGEGDQRYQELKDGIYHGYQPLRARKTITYSYTPDFIPGALNIAVARDIDSIPSGPKDANDYQMVTAHKVNRAPLPEDPYAWSAPRSNDNPPAAQKNNNSASNNNNAAEKEEEEE